MITSKTIGTSVAQYSGLLNKSVHKVKMKLSNLLLYVSSLSSHDETVEEDRMIQRDTQI
ncbi:MAG: hypothetical protein H0V14_05905 [Chitinophagaceae bacterium]|nr:hypothetical protein [Chitinophagaceae bacterium]